MGDASFGAPGELTVTSTAFGAGQPIPRHHACDGADVSPALRVAGFPAATRSVAWIVDNPDAPGKTWLHWSVCDLSPRSANLAQGADVSALGGRQGTTDFGRTGYGGPCPPSGTHRYFHKAYALDAVLGLGDRPSPDQLKAAMDGHVLAWGQLIGTYERR